MTGHSERAARALKMLAELPSDPTEALATLDEARRAYGAFLGHYGVCYWVRSRSRALTLAAAAVIAALSIGFLESGPVSTVHAAADLKQGNCEAGYASVKLYSAEDITSLGK